MKKLCSLVLVVTLFASFSGCSSIMALRQPKKKDLEIFNRGISRENVITYMGEPASSEIVDGKKVDTFVFKQGYSGGARASRATMHIIFDLFTIFIWELIGMPIEALNRGQKMTVKVFYDHNDQIENSEAIDKK